MRIALLQALFCLLAPASAMADPTGRVLILDNELLMEGDIRREGDRYVIRRGAGETIIPAARVLELVADRHAAYLAMRGRCNLRDFDDRVRLVRWCMDNQLRDEALLEVEQLVKYRPDDASLQRLAVGLRELKPERPKATPPAANKIVAVELPDYNPESFPLFVAKVQPILMNACIRCHGPHDGNGFALLPTGDGSNRKAALANLAASLKAVKRSDLANSPLLLQAVQVHGKSVTPPLRDPQGQAFQYLETWVRMAVPEEPARLPEAVVAAPMAPAVVPMEKPIAKTSFGETSTTQPKPEPQREPKDPFDPAIFNGTIRKVGE